MCLATAVERLGSFGEINPMIIRPIRFARWTRQAAPLKLKLEAPDATITQQVSNECRR